MHTELLRLEFEHYDIDEDGTISGLDFARSVASYADLAKVDKLLDHAASLPRELATMPVSSSLLMKGIKEEVLSVCPSSYVLACR